MTKVFGGEASLMGQVAYVSGREGWIALDWQRFCKLSSESHQQIRQFLNGEAEIILFTERRNKLSTKGKIIQFYNDVFGLEKEAKAALKGVPRFKKNGKLDCFDLRLSPEILTDELIIQRLIEWMPGILDIDLTQLTDIQELPEAHVRPEGSYVFRHIGGAEPDPAHLGKPLDKAIAEDVSCLVYREYLIATLRNFWEKGVLLDCRGWWTRLYSTWVDDGYPVACGGRDGTRINTGQGSRDFPDPWNGVREVSFVLTA